MFSRSVKVVALFVAGVVASIGSTARADNINTSGTVCQNYNAAQALDIDYFGYGVRDINPDSRSVICGVARSPVNGGLFAELFVDGHNNPASATSCTVSVYLADGTFSASQAFIESVGLFEDARSWHHLVIFTLGQLPPSAYVSALCTLPGNGQGVLYGVTAIQP